MAPESLPTSSQMPALGKSTPPTTSPHHPLPPSTPLKAAEVEPSTLASEPFTKYDLHRGRLTQQPPSLPDSSLGGHDIADRLQRASRGSTQALPGVSPPEGDTGGFTCI